MKPLVGANTLTELHSGEEKIISLLALIYSAAESFSSVYLLAIIISYSPCLRSLLSRQRYYRRPCLGSVGPSRRVKISGQNTRRSTFQVRWTKTALPNSLVPTNRVCSKPPGDILVCPGRRSAPHKCFLHFLCLFLST
jgi:hypothetical protein